MSAIGAEVNARPTKVGGSIKARFQNDTDGIRGRYTEERLLKHAKYLGVKKFTVPLLDTIFFPDPDFPLGAACVKCAKPIEKAMISVALDETGVSLVNDEGVLESGNVRVIGIPNGRGGCKFIPLFFCEADRWTESIVFVRRDRDGAAIETVEISLDKKRMPCQSLRRASAKAKRLNRGGAKKTFSVRPRTHSPRKPVMAQDEDVEILTLADLIESEKEFPRPLAPQPVLTSHEPGFHNSLNVAE